MQQGQERIQRTEDRAKADGVVTSGERARIQHQQNVQSRHIERFNNNSRRATR